MPTKRHIDIYSAGCPCCQRAIALVEDIKCESCEVEIHDMSDADVAERAESLGIESVPAVVIDGTLAECCKNRGVDEETLRQAGVGTPLES